MKIVLVGYTGFVGSSILRSPLFAQHEFICIGRDELSKNRLPSDFYLADALIYTIGVAHDIAGEISDQLYYKVNVDLLKKVYDEFLKSSIKSFIYFSSIKVVCDTATKPITELTATSPKTIYGKTKLIAEEYILDNSISTKTYFILRPSMIHGPNNRGNLNALYNYLLKGLPWIFGNFDNKRTFASVNNVLFVLSELLINKKIESGIYNICDDEKISTNSIIKIFEEVTNKKVLKINISKRLIFAFVKLSTLLRLKFDHHFLEKLVGDFVIDNSKIKNAIGKEFPITSYVGLKLTFKSFAKN